MMILLTVIVVVAGFCLLFLTIVTPWLAFDWWMHYAEHHTILISTGLKNAAGMTATAIGIIFIDFKLVQWSVRLVRNMKHSMNSNK